MKMRARRRFYKTFWIRGLLAELRLPRRAVILQVAEVGHDEHNSWLEFLVARFK